MSAPCSAEIWSRRQRAQLGGLVDQGSGDRVTRLGVVEDVLVERGRHAERGAGRVVLELLADADLVALRIEHLDPLGAELGEPSFRHS